MGSLSLFQNAAKFMCTFPQPDVAHALNHSCGSRNTCAASQSCGGVLPAMGTQGGRPSPHSVAQEVTTKHQETLKAVNSPLPPEGKSR